jgi:hypothetical protein
VQERHQTRGSLTAPAWAPTPGPDGARLWPSFRLSALERGRRGQVARWGGVGQGGGAGATEEGEILPPSRCDAAPLESFAGAERRKRGCVMQPRSTKGT